METQNIKAFIIPCETWYKNVILGDRCIYIGMYYESGGTDGEFKIVWDDIGIQLQAYDDSWKVLSQMPELIGLMSRIQIEESKPTISEFAEMLKVIGFKDMTSREAGKEKNEDLIEKFNNESIAGLTDLEQMRIFNALKDLEMYQKTGTIAEFMDLKSVIRQLEQKIIEEE